MTVAPGPTFERVKWTWFGVRMAGTLAFTKPRSGPIVTLTHASRAGSSPLFAKATVAATMSAGGACGRGIGTPPEGTNGPRTRTGPQAVAGRDQTPVAVRASGGGPVHGDRA